jgi:hypothetical protein
VAHQEVIFEFAFDPRFRAAALVFGVTPNRAAVTVTDQELHARFGPWHIATPLSNIAKVSLTGPYKLVKTAGPARLTFSDRGITFATNPRQGVQIDFREAVKGIEPAGLLRHPNLTVTVADCSALLAEIESRLSAE